MTMQIYSGGSVGGAAMMNEEKTDICLNWAGAHSAYSRPLVCHAHLALSLTKAWGCFDLSCGRSLHRAMTLDAVGLLACCR